VAINWNDWKELVLLEQMNRKEDEESISQAVIHNVPGDHVTMNDSPNVEVVAEVLKKRLAEPTKIT
jgi:thioesterase domain-containing protein